MDEATPTAEVEVAERSEPGRGRSPRPTSDTSPRGEDDKAGHDVVETSVNGHVVHEFWTASDGSRGESFFYYMPAQKKWKQIWVTEQGTYKEKVSEPVKDGVRFAGTVFLPDGRTVQDRTTLTRLPKGEVRQVIEWSRDGKSWTVSFDAVYKSEKA